MRGVVLQVRLDSTRLPNKALLKIGDLTIIEHAMRSLLLVEADRYIIVTTSDSVETLKPLADKWGYNTVVGSKEDVLSRFIKAIDTFNLTQIVRATGDNPLVSAKLANILIKRHEHLGLEYSGFLNNPVGTGVEVVDVSALKIAHSSTESRYDREHVTPYLYKNPELFKVFQGPAPQEYLLPDTYVTLDTSDDFKRIEKLYDELYDGQIISLESVIEWLKKEQLSYIPI